MDDTQIQQAIQDAIKDAETKAGFGVSLVPFHTHNGVDAPAIDVLDLDNMTAHTIIIGNGNKTVTLLAPGASGTVLTSNGASADPSYQASTSANIQTFTASGAGTWTKPSGTPKKVFVQAWGGGGSGAAHNATGGSGGGGGGGYVERWYDASSLGATESLSVGLGGAVAVAPNADGNNGASSTFSSGANLLTAYYGGAGTGANGVLDSGAGGGGGSTLGAGGSGGAAGIPTAFSGAGGSGAGGNAYLGAGGGGSTTASQNGGTSHYGGAGGGGQRGVSAGSSGGTSVMGGNGGASNAGIDSTPATDGAQPGGGGGGATGASSNGGKGGDGKVVVTTFF